MNDHIETGGHQERKEQELLAELRELGYRPAVRCLSCGQWLVAHKSIQRHLGPVCARRAKDTAA
ncbi:hypothetical protein JWS13_17600 [Rhodococcus pseudokoreensis]|uniref:C2H2-type domain-containing protein n=1 Tax=Rhodococcus pseudokoreensis TaxID=2811421 RepID=A0A974W431_9NOCA|nr:DUF6011 domain-containing protein [Rhodococcus pseudokoreensis]QSE90305.1 hypothetical protein JWS13_17600 [Rhodococcus pseudokoreensis]